MFSCSIAHAEIQCCVIVKTVTKAVIFANCKTAVQIMKTAATVAHAYIIYHCTIACGIQCACTYLHGIFSIFIINTMSKFNHQPEITMYQFGVNRLSAKSKQRCGTRAVTTKLCVAVMMMIFINVTILCVQTGVCNICLNNLANQM